MFRTFHIGKWKQKWLQILVMWRTFIFLSISSAMFFIVLGLGGMIEHKFGSSPLSSMKRIAIQLSTRFFVNMMAMEVPHLPQGKEAVTLTSEQVVKFFVWLITNVNPLDPKTLLAGEVPGMNNNILNDAHNRSLHDIIPNDVINKDKSEGEAPQTSVTSTNTVSNKLNNRNNLENKATDNQNLNKVVFIYHSHNRESWNPVLKQQGGNPNDARKNITLVGRRLQKQLERRRIGAAHSYTDYASSVKEYNWSMSYKYSKQTVKEAMSSNKNLHFFFDIHRDSIKRKDSTVTIKGKDYATVYFIIGHRNPGWRRNEQLASELHERLEKRYPGISRGIWGKTASQGHGEYNQSLSPNSIVIEIGGVDNTLEETYRTVDILAELITDIIHKRNDAKFASIS